MRHGRNSLFHADFRECSVKVAVARTASTLQLSHRERPCSLRPSAIHGLISIGGKGWTRFSSVFNKNRSAMRFCRRRNCGTIFCNETAWASCCAGHGRSDLRDRRVGCVRDQTATLGIRQRSADICQDFFDCHRLIFSLPVASFSSGFPNIVPHYLRGKIALGERGSQSSRRKIRGGGPGR